MKKGFYFMAALLVAMISCNKEPQGENTGISADDRVYMTFSVETVTTRTATGSTTTEVGTTEENTISSVDIVLTNDDSYVVAKRVTAEKVTAIEPSGTHYIASFSSDALEASKVYDVYIYANCSAPESKNLNATSDVGISTMTVANNFWMTNANRATSVTLPADLSLYTTENSPVNLGVHKVERSMARLDIKPGQNGSNALNVYTLADNSTTVTLTKAALVNQSKSFYMLRRVSDDGTNSGWEIGGSETPTNYVVDTDYAAKTSATFNTSISANFDSYMNDASTWTWTDMPTSTDYTPWKYCKENTIPGTNQYKGYATAVVFKGKITSTNTTVSAAMTEKKDIFVFENTLYGSWDDVKTAAEATGASPTLIHAVSVITALAETNRTREAYENAGFTYYSADSEGNYYTYYYYYNRHNDNSKPEETGPMEFAVVRNNVYKLCVKDIKKLGLPTTEDTPPTDIEDDINYYFNVTVQVLPWGVRVNDIEF